MEKAPLKGPFPGSENRDCGLPRQKAFDQADGVVVRQFDGT